jgi:hypothetical protein
VVQGYEGGMDGVVYEREEMEREYTTLAVPVESWVSNATRVIVRCDITQCNARL